MSDRMRGLVLWGFAGIGLLAALAMIFVAVTLLRLGDGWRPEPAPVEAKAPGPRFTVAETSAIPGSELVEIVIATEASMGRGQGSYSSGGAERDERNVILLDKASGANRRLLPDNGRQIVLRRYLPASVEAVEEANGSFIERAADGEQRLARAAYYLLRVRAADGKSEDVLLGNLVTGRQAIVLKGIDGVDRFWMQSDTRVAMLMRQNRKLFFRAFEIPDLRLVAARPVEID